MGAIFKECTPGIELTDWLVKHSQRKRGETDRPILRSTAPVLDPTKLHMGIPILFYIQRYNVFPG
jgi:hypothetical protein